MAETDIEWTDVVWNVTRGCRRVSPGCGGPGNVGGCYAERQAYRFSGPGQPYEGLVQLTARGPRWTGKGRFVPEKLDEPLRWKKPRRVFVDSMSDLFFEAFTFEQIAAVFGVMAAARKHTFQLLTKRPERALEFFNWLGERAKAMDRTAEWFVQNEAYQLLQDRFPVHKVKGALLCWPWPLTNVWLGVSVENQETADERIPLLLKCPAAIRWVSAEPLLGPINFGQSGLSLGVPLADGTRWFGDKPGLDWVVVGGESGPGARGMDVAWMRGVVEQCRAAAVPVFSKQFGAEPYTVEQDEVVVGKAPFAKRAKLQDDGSIHRWPWMTNGKGADLAELPGEWPREFPAALT